MDRNLISAGEVAQSFFTVSRALTGFSQRNASSLGLTLTQMGLLNTIFASPGATLKNISEKLQLPKSTASVGVDELTGMGLVERKASDDDRREVVLTVTEKGEELAGKSISCASSYRAMASALTKLQEQEIMDLMRMHQTILAALRESEAPGDA